jgi:hypothetical protein
MNRRSLPNGVLAKLIELDEQAEFFNRKVADTERGIAAARTRLTGGFRKDQEYHDLRRTLDQLIADKPVLERKHHRTKHLASACREWLDALPKGTELELVEVKPDGHDLDEVRDRIKETKDELKALRAVSTPAHDIAQRVKAYVQSLARPEVSGIGEDEELEVIWPTNVLTAFALLLPEKIEEVILAEVDAAANDLIPIKERPARIAELEEEIERLAYLEEALVVASGAERSRSASPQAVLGVRVVDKRVARAAA